MTTNTEHRDGVKVGFYPQRLSEDDLQCILDLAGNTRFQHKSPGYAAWLVSVVKSELQRRESEDTDTPDEVAVPALNAAKWSGGELADALITSGVACTLARGEGRAVVVELFEQVDALLRGWAAARLRDEG